MKQNKFKDNIMLKKTPIILVTAVLISSVSAQKRAINSAEYALESGAPEDLVIAYEEIEKAKLNPKTATMPKMWLVRARVFSNIFDKRSNPIFANIRYQAGLESAKSIINFYESPVKKSSSENEDAKITVGNSFAATFNETQTYNDKLIDAKGEAREKLHDTMLVYFDNLVKMYEKLDTSMVNDLKGQKIDRIYFMERIAYYALNNSSKENRFSTIKNLATKEYPIPFVIESYSKLLLEKGDTTEAKQAIKAALVKSNYNNDIFNVLVNYYLSIDQQDKLMEEVDLQIKEAPNSKNYWIRGYLNERSNNFSKATEDYKKSRELDEFNHDANWNLGVALMKYETKEIIEKIAKTSDASQKAKLEKDKLEIFKTAKGYLEYASENAKYSKDELINISNAIRTCCLEIGDNACSAEQRDKVRMLNGFNFKVGDKFTYRILGDATKMQISYQNARNTNSTVYDHNGDFEKTFDAIDLTDVLSLSVTIKGAGEATLYIIVNGVPVEEKTISGKDARGYLKF
jgi:hypothetical protein